MNLELVKKLVGLYELADKASLDELFEKIESNPFVFYLSCQHKISCHLNSLVKNESVNEEFKKEMLSLLWTAVIESITACLAVQRQESELSKYLEFIQSKNKEVLK